MSLADEIRPIMEQLADQQNSYELQRLKDAARRADELLWKIGTASIALAAFAFGLIVGHLL